MMGEWYAPTLTWRKDKHARRPHLPCDALARGHYHSISSSSVLYSLLENRRDETTVCLDDSSADVRHDAGVGLHRRRLFLWARAVVAALASHRPGLLARHGLCLFHGDRD